ncbi:MAG: hypothetical protein WBIAU2_11860 [Wolbachia endosymbiont of Drosophila biauraria]|nr:MAG: hypothetical protein WBIAU2_11860 [Wolbachia endosymbiont of Drosophila biauraria]
MFGSNFRDFVSQDTTSRGQSNSERLIKSCHGFEKPDSEDLGIEEEFEVLDSESQEIPATPCSTPSEDLSLENAILANFPGDCDRLFTVESKDEGSFDTIPKSLTFAEITNILNQAIQEDNCEELDKVVQNIEDYEGRSITLDSVNLKSFCEQQLNLDLQDRGDHQHIYSNVLSQYKFDQENFERDYSVKELVLLATAANDKLVEQYQDFLSAEENLSLLPVLVGDQKYIEAFIEKFHGTDGVCERLEGQAIQLVESNKIDFFSVIALRKEQELLETVFVEYVLRDFGQALKTSKPNPLYGALETASLIKNEEFITIVLDAFERYINEPTKKASTEELLKKSFATLLEAAISQERTSVIEYLCKRYTNSADRAIYDVYEQAFADDKVMTILRQQILKNIGVRGRKEIYDLILKTALDAGNIAFIEHLCEQCAKCSNDVINYLDHKSKNNEFDEIYELILIALSNTESQDIIVSVLAHVQIYQSILNNKQQVVRQTIQNILRNAIKEASYGVVVRNLLESSKSINTSSKANIQTQANTQVNKRSSSDNAVSLVIKGDTAVVNEENNNQSSSQRNPKSKSAGSQQTEKNVLAGEEENAILNNVEVSTKEPLINNFQEDKVGKGRGKKGVNQLPNSVRKKIDGFVNKANPNLREEIKNTIEGGWDTLALQYVKNKKGPFKDKVEEIIEEIINCNTKQDNANISLNSDLPNSGDQSTSSNNTGSNSTLTTTPEITVCEKKLEVSEVSSSADNVATTGVVINSEEKPAAVEKTSAINNQSSSQRNPKSKSAGSQQTEKNVLAGEEENAILNNVEVSTKEPLINNFQEDKVEKGRGKKVLTNFLILLGKRLMDL